MAFHDSIKQLIFLLLPGLIVSGCGIFPSTSNLTPTPDGLGGQNISIGSTATQITEEVNSENQLTNLIGDILADPGKYQEQSVEIVGYYRGWDILHETQQAPPVSRSDWVVADAGGAIYVTGLAPPGLNPASQAGAPTMLRLSATVKYIEQSKTVYLYADHVEMLDK